jgi:hypothetical protein
VELLNAKRRELEAEAALAAIVAQKVAGIRRWIVLGVLGKLCTGDFG